MSDTPNPELHDLRRAMRSERAALDPETRAVVSAACVESILSCNWYRAARRIAIYLPVAGEVEVIGLAQAAWGSGRQVMIPKLLPGSAGMRFARLEPDSELRPNRYGIPEPSGSGLVSASAIDLIILPVVAFDWSGTRIGMGAGFYDRCLRIRRTRAGWRRPKLIGAAFGFQACDPLPRFSWDVPMDGVATEDGLHRFEPRIRPCATG